MPVEMKSFDAREAIRRSEEIYAIVDRLGQPQTGAELAHIQELIDAGADLEVRYNSGNSETLLHIAITRNYTAAALLLLKNGADMNARCVQEITPFIWAAMYGSEEVLQAMFDSGKAPPPDRDSYDSLGEGKTALMCAAEGNKAGCALFLIRQGADIDLKNAAGKSALDYALEKGHAGLARQMVDLRNTLEMDAALRGGANQPVAVMRPLALKGRIFSRPSG
jgi:uncharacterized protein